MGGHALQGSKTGQSLHHLPTCLRGVSSRTITTSSAPGTPSRAMVIFVKRGGGCSVMVDPVCVGGVVGVRGKMKRA